MGGTLAFLSTAWAFATNWALKVLIKIIKISSKPNQEVRNVSQIRRREGDKPCNGTSDLKLGLSYFIKGWSRNKISNVTKGSPVSSFSLHWVLLVNICYIKNHTKSRCNGKSQNSTKTWNEDPKKLRIFQ